MKITKQQLKEIIKEELETLVEARDPWTEFHGRSLPEPEPVPGREDQLNSIAKMLYSVYRDPNSEEEMTKGYAEDYVRPALKRFLEDEHDRISKVVENAYIEAMNNYEEETYG
jgi:hypothetical protein